MGQPLLDDPILQIDVEIMRENAFYLFLLRQQAKIKDIIYKYRSKIPQMLGQQQMFHIIFQLVFIKPKPLKPPVPSYLVSQHLQLLK